MLSLARSLALLGYILPLVTSRGLFEPHAAPVARATASVAAGVQVPAVGVNAYFCEQVAISLPVTVRACVAVCANVVLNVNFGTQCLCVAGGVLTPASQTTLSTTVALNNPALTAAVGTLSGTTTVDITKALSDATSLVTTTLDADAGTKGTCNYPIGSTPNSCTSCTFTCPNSLVPCGSAGVNPSCVASCPSGLTRRSFSVAGDASDFRCPVGQSVCGVPHGARRSEPSSPDAPFECIDTQSDIESCGGCVTPYRHHRATGTDCTAIQNSMGVKCHFGECRVITCEKGYRVNRHGKECEQVRVDGKNQTAFGEKKGSSTGQRIAKQKRANAKKAKRSSAKFR